MGQPQNINLPLPRLKVFFSIHTPNLYKSLRFVTNFSSMNFPDNLRYTKDHEWVRVENGNVAVIGITDFAQGELGDIVYVDINTVGESLKKEEIFGTVEAVKTVSDLFMPLSGKVLEVNPGLDGAPEKVNGDPYGDGWMIKVEMSDPSEFDALMPAADYKASIGH